MNQKTESTHTPGPWHIGMNPGPIVYGPNGEQVTDMRRGMLHLDEDVSNIRLIAAAPELLEALKRVRHAFYVDGSSKALRLAFENTKELVAKAEGRI